VSRVGADEGQRAHPATSHSANAPKARIGRSISGEGRCGPSSVMGPRRGAPALHRQRGDRVGQGGEQGAALRDLQQEPAMEASDSGSSPAKGRRKEHPRPRDDGARNAAALAHAARQGLGVLLAAARATTARAPRGPGWASASGTLRLRKGAARCRAPTSSRRARRSGRSCRRTPGPSGGRRRRGCHVGAIPPHWPTLGLTRPASALRSVVFPEPAGPQITARVPAENSAVSRSSAATAPKRTVSAEAARCIGATVCPAGAGRRKGASWSGRSALEEAPQGHLLEAARELPQPPRC